MEETHQPGLPGRQGLYDSRFEHDACGVGLVADLNNRPSHRIVEQGLTVLRRLAHRGAAGWDPETGDGAGLLVALPDTFFRARVEGLPAVYAVAMVFGGEGHEAAFEAILREEGFTPIAWREVPVCPEAIGRSARASRPRIRQLFVAPPEGCLGDVLERRLFIARRRAEKALGEGLYCCSFSARSVVYKGLLLAHQLNAFYEDLRAPDFASALAVAHQRYSTNTFPTWNLAQPFRLLAHNGEINTLRGNLAALRAREPGLASPLFGEELAKVLPLVPPGQSDSACLDNMLELLVRAGRDLPHAMLMLLPQAWGPTHHMGNDVRGFLEYESALMEPWDGPAAVVFSDGLRAGAVLDRNGLRPARYALCRDGTFVLASEAGVLDLPPGDIVRRGRLRPGEMIWLDLAAHRVLGDAEIKAHVARRRPYRRWVEENRISVDGLFRETAPDPVPGGLAALQRRFGYSREDVASLLLPMARQGQEPVGSMGDDSALAVLSDRPRLLFDYFKQRFAQVTNPPIDPIRERSVMSLMTYVGNRANILEETPAHARLIKMRRPILTDAEVERLGHVGAEEFRPATLRLAFPAGGDGGALGAALEALAEGGLRGAEPGLGDAVGAEEEAVAQAHREGGVGEGAALPARQGVGGALDGAGHAAAQERGRGVLVLDHADLAAGVGADHGEGGVGDVAVGADGQGVHDERGGAAQAECGAHVGHRHGGGEAGADVGLLAAAEAVGEDGDHRAVGQALAEEDVAAAHLAELAAVEPIHLDEGGRRPRPRVRAHWSPSVSMGANISTAESRISSLSAALRPSMKAISWTVLAVLVTTVRAFSMRARRFCSLSVTSRMSAPISPRPSRAPSGRAGSGG